MNADRKALRDRIRAAYLVRPVLTRTMAEAYLDKYPEDGFVWAMYGDTLRSMGCFTEARTALVTARPRWTLQNRPFVDGSKPAISGGRDRVKVYRVASSGRKSV
jgi:hypothetical protein